MSGWTARQLATLREHYADNPTSEVARHCGHSVSGTYQQAIKLGLRKSRAYLSGDKSGRFMTGHTRGPRFQKGMTPYNKGLRRPGWAPGRMAETQFKRGHRSVRWPEDVYHVGCLREHRDGVEIKMHDGHRPWRPLHVVLWEDAHGPVPRGHVVTFRDRDRLNIELPNLECIPRAEIMRRNSVHNLPKPLASAIHLIGQLNRRIREHEKHR